RMLMVLDRKELCVCQLMGIIGQSQPMISRNLSILSRAGFLEERKEGKLKFYKIKKALSPAQREILRILRNSLSDDEVLKQDMATLKECTEFQKLTGRCDMETFREFMKRKRQKLRRVV
ncbi:MAG: transcriptional regulator, partial [Nitrospirae bacterium]